MFQRKGVSMCVPQSAILDGVGKAGTANATSMRLAALKS